MKLLLRAITLAFALILDGPSAFCELPDPLVLESGQPIKTAKEWREQRRPEILELFRTHVYGRAPVSRPENLSFKAIEVDKNAMDREAALKRIEISFSRPGGSGKIEPVIFIPNNRTLPAPGFLLIQPLCEPCWKLWEHPGLTAPEQPAVNTPAQGGYIGYHLREGKHDLGLSDCH